MTVPVFVSYSIPRINLSNNRGSFNHATTDNLNIITGTTNHFTFMIGDTYGRKLTTSNLNAKILFWYGDEYYKDLPSYSKPNVIFTKNIEIVDPYSGQLEVSFSIDDSMTLGYHAIKGQLKWSFILYNDTERYLLKIGKDLNPVGIVNMDYKSFPLWESESI